jgi:hypothetical protein
MNEPTKEEIIEKTNTFIKDAVNATKKLETVTEPQDVIQRFEFKFKDKPGKSDQIISNKAGKYLVVKQIIFHKVPNENNKMVMVLVMPDPRFIEVVEKVQEEKDVKKGG